MYKMLPDSLYNIPAVESWLGDMARRGLRCVGIFGEVLAEFEDAAPEDCCYRLEPKLRDGGPDPERQALYREMGWEFVCATRREEFYLWRSARPDAPELHTDPVAQDMALSWVSSIQRHWLLADAALTALFFALLYMIGRSDGWVLPYARHGMSTNFVNLFVVVWGCGTLYQDWKVLRRLRQTLAAGIPMEHEAPYGARRRARRVYLVIAAALFAVALGETSQDSVTHQRVSAETPAVALEELGAEADRERDSLLEGLLLGDRLLVWQQGAEGGSTTEVFDLRLPLLSGLLLHDLAVHDVREAAEALPEPLADARFDELRYVRGAHGIQHLLARRGGRVLYMTAEVPEDLRDHLNALDGAMSRPMRKGDT